MKNINTIVCSTLIASTFLFGNSIDGIGFHLGKGYSDWSQTDKTGSITLGELPSKNYDGGELYLDFKEIQKNIKPTLSYTYTQNSDLKHHYILGGVNKYIQEDKVKLYGGVVFGYGQIDWESNPINNSKENDYKATSFIGGIQLGTLYPINEKLSFGINGKYLFHNYETNLKPTPSVHSVIEHDRSGFIGFGFRYSL